MDLNTLKVPQLKNTLRKYQLPITKCKTKLILRKQEADPTDAWIAEATQYDLNDDNIEEDGSEKGTAPPDTGN